MKACKKCHKVLEKGIRCPKCKEKTLSSNYTGIIIIFDPNKSLIGKQIKAESVGNYAIRVK